MPKAETKTKSIADPNEMPKQRVFSAEERYRMIAEAAYFRAENRGFTGGNVAEDWLQAEAEIDRYLRVEKAHGHGVAPAAKEIEQQVVAAFESDPAAVAERVRTITLQALSGHLDTKSLKSVMTAVLKGAQLGARSGNEHRTQTLREAVRGLDDALATAAEATRLAIQEAAGRTSEFSGQELKKAANDLATLESQFIDTLGKAARSATGVAQATLHDLAEHARTSGTAVGSQVKSALSQLTGVIADTAREKTAAGTQVLRQEGALLAALATGVLNGISARLHSTPAEKTAPPPSGRGG
jgi:hypothetical protein